MTVLNAVCEDKMYIHGYWNRHSYNLLANKKRCYNKINNDNENENKKDEDTTLIYQKQRSASSLAVTANELPKRASVWRQLA